MAKILMVDDDVDLADTVVELLDFEKHSVEVVHSGAQGWERARDNQYDLLLLDWDLPDLTGIKILKRYREAGGMAPVIMLTGHNSVSDKEIGLDFGADDYITKPFAMDELSARIRAALRRGAMQAPVYQPLGTNNEDVLKRANLGGSLLASRYEFLEVLGEGGIGIVFKARQPLMEKLVAIKMLHFKQQNQEIVERFNLEAKAVSRLDHHNAIAIYDFGVTECGQPFMVMEYILGWNLADLIRQQGALPLEFTLDICIQICDGMAHAHATGVLHRDIKPANIILKHYDEGPPVVKILDFGLAKLKDLDPKNSPALTKAGQVFGSPMYMSPEQAKGQTVDERSDIYSLGCILYEMLSGMAPHLSDNTMTLMFMHVSEEAKPLHELRPDLDLPESIEPVISKVLNKDPEQRYQTMRALKEDLEQIRRNQQSSASNPSPKP